MATAETIGHHHGQNTSPSGDRHTRRRPFTNLMKRLASLKNSSESSSHGSVRFKKGSPAKNNPYPESGVRVTRARTSPSTQGSLSSSSPGHISIKDSPDPSHESLVVSHNGQNVPVSEKSAAPTVSTNPETTHSTQSKNGTVNTGGGAVSSTGIGGEGSTFSSPAPSVRSLTTTLTTIQSAAPANIVALPNNYLAPTSNQQQQTVHFSHQFPTSPPASAIPSHVIGHPTHHPSSYVAATANNLLTDNASIVTLASSSKRRRRNSLDTNASVKALAPSSIFGGSRESLPLSVLSGPAGGEPSSGLSAFHNRPSIGGLPAAERASVYSSSGAAPALSSERNSYYKQSNTGDGASIRSGLLGHSRNDSITGSIGGAATSPWTSPRETIAPGKTSRRNSVGWGDVDEEENGDEEA